jgi:hypothetical protein
VCHVFLFLLVSNNTSIFINVTMKLIIICGGGGKTTLTKKFQGYSNKATGSHAFHAYLAEKLKVKDKLLLETRRIH